MPAPGVEPGRLMAPGFESGRVYLFRQAGRPRTADQVVRGQVRS